MTNGHVTTVSSPPTSPIPSKRCIRLQLWPMPGHGNGGLNAYYYFGTIKRYPLKCKLQIYTVSSVYFLKIILTNVEIPALY